MDEIIDLLKNLKYIKVILVYVAEAYSDDNWPMGFGINEAKTTQERKDRLNQLLEIHPNLKPYISGFIVDNMEN